jgi:hypothetical protein
MTAKHHPLLAVDLHKFDGSEPGIRRLIDLADDATRLMELVFSFEPSTRQKVVIYYGPTIVDTNLAANVQPYVYSIYWVAPESEDAPEATASEIARIEAPSPSGVRLQVVIWVLSERLDVIDLAQKLWKRTVTLPVVRVLS